MRIDINVQIDIKTLSKEELDSLKKALEEFGVLFFRNQDLDPKSYIKFAKNVSFSDYICLGFICSFHVCSMKAYEWIKVTHWLLNGTNR